MSFQGRVQAVFLLGFLSTEFLGQILVEVRITGMRGAETADWGKGR